MVEKSCYLELVIMFMFSSVGAASLHCFASKAGVSNLFDLESQM